MKKKGPNNSLTREGKNINNQSLLTDHTSDLNLNNDSRFNNSFEVNDSIVDNSIEHGVNHSTPMNSLADRIAQRKQSCLRPLLLKRDYLNKVVTNAMLNSRLAFKKIQELPRILFKKGLGHDIAEALVKKTRINLETSLIRSILYSAEFKREESKLHLQRGQNTFIMSTPATTFVVQKEALLLLNQSVKSQIKFCLKQFQLNRQLTITLGRYFSKVCSNYQVSRVAAFAAIKHLPGKGRKGCIDRQTLVLGQLSQKMEKWMRQQIRAKVQALGAIKMESLRIRLGQQHAGKNILLFGKLRREQAFLRWRQSTVNGKREQQKNGRVEEQRVRAVRGIMMRNYLKLMKEITRRIFSYQRVAVRLGCSSRLNQQKAMWRLMLNLYNSGNQA